MSYFHVPPFASPGCSAPPEDGHVQVQQVLGGRCCPPVFITNPNTSHRFESTLNFIWVADSISRCIFLLVTLWTKEKKAMSSHMLCKCPFPSHVLSRKYRDEWALTWVFFSSLGKIIVSRAGVDGFEACLAFFFLPSCFGFSFLPAYPYSVGLNSWPASLVVMLQRASKD